MNTIVEVKPSADLLLVVFELTSAILTHAAALDRLAGAQSKPARSVSVAVPPVDETIAATVEMPPEPEAKPPNRRTRPVTVWTPERLGVLKRDYPAGVGRDVVLAALNALPGPPISLMALKARTKASGLRRPTPPATAAQPGETPEPKPAIAIAPVVDAPLVNVVGSQISVPMALQLARSPNPAPAAAPNPARGRPYAIGQGAITPPVAPAPVRMDGEQLLRWASERGIRLHLPIQEADLDACQAKARAIGHPAIEFTGRVRS